ncbi:MAG: sensor histidine kinase [Planctomycetota bacterium]
MTIGPFSWHTLSLQDRPTLVALREVATPEAALTQGFVASSDAVVATAGPTRHPLRFLPGAPEAATDALVPLDGDPWHIAVDPAAALGLAGAEAARLRGRFHLTFASGFALALLAAGALVLLVARTERLALERARFAASAAHELRTPLAGLQLYGEMLAGGHGDPARSADYARRIGQEADRLGRVVTNVLGLTRLEQGDLGVRPRVDDLSSAVTRTLEQLAPAFEARGIGIREEIAGPPLRALFDADALHQIVQNLLDNAEKYSRSASDRAISVRLARFEGGVRLSVLDRGPGVLPAERRALFRPFERGAGAERPAGLGLGLALVRALAQAQGAVAAHTARDGGGSEFSVTFRTEAVRAAS